MKKMTKLFALILFCFGITGCFSGIPLQTGASANNKTYEVSYLFEHVDLRGIHAHLQD